MKTIPIPYGRGTQDLQVEESRLRAVLAPLHMQTETGDQSAIVREALHHPRR